MSIVDKYGRRLYLNPKVKPQADEVVLDTNADVNERLEICLLFNEKGGLPVNLTGKSSPYFVNATTSTPIRRIEDSLEVLDFSQNVAAVDTDYAIDSASLEGLTVEMYIKNAATAGNLMITENGLNHTGDTFYLNQDKDGEHVFLVKGTGGTSDYQYTVSNVDWVAGEWIHVVGVWRPDENIAIYLDGVDRTGTPSGSVQAELQDGNRNVRIGHRPDTVEPWTGQMSHYRLWSRGLSEEEIVSLYTDGFYQGFKPKVERLPVIRIPTGGSGTNNLLADDVESTSEVGSPSIGQTHDLAPTSVESASEVSTPTLGQVHGLLADDVESTSEVSTPTAGEAGHALFADDIESTSEVSSPVIGQTHNITADDVESNSEVGTPVLAQVHQLFADDIESTSEVSTPNIATGADHNLAAEDVESASEVSTPTLAQVHVLVPTSTESASEVSTPSLGGEVTLADLQAQIEALTLLVQDLYVRLDLDGTTPNTYADDGSYIQNTDFTLTKVSNGDGTFTVVKT